MKISVDLKNRQEGDALKLALTHPALKTASVMTGLLLELPTDYVRHCVLTIVQQSVRLATYPTDAPPEVAADNGNLGRIHDGGSSPE